MQYSTSIGNSATKSYISPSLKPEAPSCSYTRNYLLALPGASWYIPPVKFLETFR